MPTEPLPGSIPVALSDHLLSIYMLQGHEREDLAQIIDRLSDRLLCLGDPAGLVGLSVGWRRDHNARRSLWILADWQVGRNVPGGWKSGAWFAQGAGGYVKGKGRREIHTAPSVRAAMFEVEKRVGGGATLRNMLHDVAQKLAETP